MWLTQALHAGIANEHCGVEVRSAGSYPAAPVSPHSAPSVTVDLISKIRTLLISLALDMGFLAKPQYGNISLL